eukprot:1158595-Pelagomonas_calceolata.AAC.1
MTHLHLNDFNAVPLSLLSLSSCTAARPVQYAQPQALYTSGRPWQSRNNIMQAVGDTMHEEKKERGEPKQEPREKGIIGPHMFHPFFAHREEPKKEGTIEFP